MSWFHASKLVAAERVSRDDRFRRDLNARACLVVGLTVVLLTIAEERTNAVQVGDDIFVS